MSSAAERRGTAVRGVGGLISSLGGLSPLCGGCLLCRGPLEATGASPHLPVGFGVPHVWMQLGAGGCSGQTPNPAAHPGGCRVGEAGGGSRVISFPCPRVAVVLPFCGGRRSGAFPSCDLRLHPPQPQRSAARLLLPGATQHLGRGLLWGLFRSSCLASLINCRSGYQGIFSRRERRVGCCCLV